MVQLNNYNTMSTLHIRIAGKFDAELILAIWQIVNYLIIAHAFAKLIRQ